MLRVVIADDEEKICELLEQLVDWNALGFEIAAFAHNGLEVLDCIRAYSPEVVITDIQMPECSGLELLERIRAEKMDIDILVISGYREFEYAKKALQYGAENYLLKPIRRAELLESLRNIRERRETRTAEQDMLRETETILNQSKEALQLKLMEDILRGDRKQITVQELNAEFRCGFTGTRQSWMTVKLDFPAGEVDTKALEILQQKNRNSVVSILAEQGVQSCCIVRWNMLLILADASVDLLDQPYHRIIRALKDFAGRGNVQVTIGAADVGENNVFRAALESSRAVMEQLFQGRNRIILYQAGKTDPAGLSRLTPDYIQRLHDAVLASEEQRLLALLKESTDDMRQGARPLQTGEGVYRAMAELVEQVFFQAQMVSKEVDLSDLRERFSLELRMCGRWTDYEQVCRSLAAELTGLLRQLQSDREKRPIKLAKEIIAERFCTQLSLDEISSELGLNSTYFSGIFKRETGMNVSAYITGLRIEKARQLLASTDDTIQQIADQVGYNDEKYFIRRFRKEVGLTPGEYRKLYG